MTLLSIENLQTSFYSQGGVVRAVDGLNLEVNLGECVALVGESGSGKTMTALSILQLVPPPGVIESGSIFFRKRNLLKLSNRQMRHIRGRQIGLILQDPLSALNPLMRVGEQIAEVMRFHFGYSRKKAKTESLMLMERVHLDDVQRIYSAYPHELSGGLRQRALIAVALAARPSLLIADEPTTALDTTIQSQILELLRCLQRELNLSLLLITHDLGVVASLAEKVAVMYAGKIIEFAPKSSLFSKPLHPYTELLLDSMPKVDWPVFKSGHMYKRQNGRSNSAGCVFSSRCYMADNDCKNIEPHDSAIDSQHYVKCIKRGTYEYGNPIQ